MEWTFEQMDFVAGRRGAVEDDFYNKVEKLNVQAGKKDKIPAAHTAYAKRMTQLCNLTISKYDKASEKAAELKKNDLCERARKGTLLFRFDNVL